MMDMKTQVMSSQIIVHEQKIKVSYPKQVAESSCFWTAYMIWFGWDKEYQENFTLAFLAWMLAKQTCSMDMFTKIEMIKSISIF